MCFFGTLHSRRTVSAPSSIDSVISSLKCEMAMPTLSFDASRLLRFFANSFLCMDSYCSTTIDAGQSVPRQHIAFNIYRITGCQKSEICLRECVRDKGKVKAASARMCNGKAYSVYGNRAFFNDISRALSWFWNAYIARTPVFLDM